MLLQRLLLYFQFPFEICLQGELINHVTFSSDGLCRGAYLDVRQIGQSLLQGFSLIFKIVCSCLLFLMVLLQHFLLLLQRGVLLFQLLYACFHLEKQRDSLRVY